MPVITEAVRLDFDQAVRFVKRWADGRGEKTKMEEDHSPETKKRMKAVPKYPSLLAVLGISEEGETDEPVAASEVEQLVAQMAMNPSTWSPSEWPA